MTQATGAQGAASEDDGGMQAALPGEVRTEATGNRSRPCSRALSDSELATHVSAGADDALAETYRRHARQVASVAASVLGNRDAADDVVQTVFLTFWDHPERFDAARGTLRGYVLTAGRGRAIDLARAEGSRRARQDRYGRDTSNPTPTVEDEAMSSSTAALLRAAVAALPDTERQALELAYFGDHTYREVATLLGLPEGTVKARIRRALQRLRPIVVTYGATPES
jgi:RNA polymerase sigma-70 factor (ECF subfamily)